MYEIKEKLKDVYKPIYFPRMSHVWESCEKELHKEK
jgi:hypothetical protein